MLRRALNRLKLSSFARNVALIASGTAIAQAITMAFAPLTTRIYGPEAFGMLGTFMAIVSVGIPLAALAYPSAIILPRDDRDALALVRLSIIISILVAIVGTVAIWLGGDWISERLGTQSVARFLFLLPLVMLLSAWGQVAEQWLLRKKAFAVIARASIANALITSVTKSSIGMLYPLGLTLILLSTAAYALQVGLLFYAILKICSFTTSPRFRYLRVVPLHALKELAHRHRDFPIFRAPQNLINAASQSLPILMLAAFFGPESAGFYTLGRLALGVPSMLVGKAVGDVFYPRLTEAEYKNESVSKMIWQATAGLIAIGLLPFGLIALLGPQLFSIIFGPDWVMAGEYATWLAIFFFFNFINKPCVAAVPALKLQRGLLIYEIFSTSAKSLGLAVGFYWMKSDLWAIALFSITGAFAYGIMMMWIYMHASRREANVKTG